MKRHQNRNLEKIAHQRSLLVALSDDLLLPLVHIKTGTQQIVSDNFAARTVREQVETMSLTAENGLHLVEAYRYLLKAEDILNMPFEPVAIGAVFEDVAHQIFPLAREYSTSISIDIQGRFAPVLAHQASLTAAMEVLSSSLIRAQAAQSQRKSYRLVLGAHRAPDGAVAAGAFSDVQGLSDRSLRAARSLVGQARQPLPAIPPGTASGILVADMLCASLWQPLRAAAHRNLGGLATSLPISKQLQFV